MYFKKSMLLHVDRLLQNCSFFIYFSVLCTGLCKNEFVLTKSCNVVGFSNAINFVKGIIFNQFRPKISCFFLHRMYLSKIHYLGHKIGLPLQLNWSKTIVTLF